MGPIGRGSMKCVCVCVCVCVCRVRSEEMLQRFKEKRNILQTMKRRKGNWVGHILRRNCLLKRVFEGKVEGMIRKKM